MGPAILGLVVLIPVAGAWWFANRRPPVADGRPPADVDLDPFDAAELDARFAAADGMASTTRDDLIAARLRAVMQRAVPVRVVEPVPSLGASRVRFADGTTLVGHGLVAGDFGVLAAAVRDNSVRVASCTRQADGMHVVFGWAGHPEGLGILVTGLDQPD